MNNFIAFSLLIIILGFTFSSCKKDPVNTDIIQINGVSDFKSAVGETKTLTLTISNSNTNLQDISLSLNNVPAGVSYSFETASGKSNFVTTLSFIISSQAKLGVYPVILEASSETASTKIPFHININDELSLSLSVYDGTKRTESNTSGELVEDAIVNLYKNQIAFDQQIPTYTCNTDSNGTAKFYHLESAVYLFTVQKNNLSNIVKKEKIKDSLLGYATVSIFKTIVEIQNSSQKDAKVGDLKYRDQNNDGIITDADRVANDLLSIYDKSPIDKVIWIGN